MPSQNVKAVIAAMPQNLDIVKKLNSAITELIKAANVQLDIQEKQALLEEFKSLVDRPEPDVHVHWS